MRYDIHPEKELNDAIHDIKIKHFASHKECELFKNSHIIYKGVKHMLATSILEQIPLNDESLKELKVYFPAKECTIIFFSNLIYIFIL